MIDSTSGEVVLRLKSKDDRIFLVEKVVAEQMKFVEHMVADVDVSDSGEIPIGEVEGVILEKVIEYCNFHHTHPLDRDTIEEIDKWERDFMNVEKSILFRMVLAANFLNIQPLLDLCCRTVADLIRGKTPEQIRAEFAMEDEFLHLCL